MPKGAHISAIEVRRAIVEIKEYIFMKCIYYIILTIVNAPYGFSGSCV
jgi:hypothetical protein